MTKFYTDTDTDTDRLPQTGYFIVTDEKCSSGTKNYTVAFSEVNGRGTNSEHVVSVMRFSSILLQMVIFSYLEIFWWFCEQH